MNKRNLTIAGAIILLSIIGLYFWGGYLVDKENLVTKTKNEGLKTQDSISQPSSKIVLSEEEINANIDNALSVLLQIHYVSQKNEDLNSPDTVIYDMLKAAMDDLNKLNSLSYQIDELHNSKNEIISTTGLTLKAVILGLSDSYSAWIQYLRGVDINNLDVAEFQYQMALFTSLNHEGYLTLIKGASLLPVVALEFGEGEGKESIVNKNIEQHFLSKIDEMFADVLKEDDEFYKETKNRNAVPVLITGYKEFFVSETK